MRTSSKGNCLPIVVALITLFSLTSCLTSKKLDKFVAEHYNHELPKQKKKVDIVVTSSQPADNAAISTTVHQTSKLLPLLVYWNYNHKQYCSLNPAIAVTNFANAVNSQASKGLTQKLNGQRLELVVDQVPSAFSIVSNEHMVWLIYAFSWAKIYIEPDKKDLVVTYRLTQADQLQKTGKITVKSTEQNKSIRYFQSWKSATSEYLADYNANLTAMTKTFVNQLTQEL